MKRYRSSVFGKEYILVSRHDLNFRYLTRQSGRKQWPSAHNQTTFRTPYAIYITLVTRYGSRQVTKPST